MTKIQDILQDKFKKKTGHFTGQYSRISSTFIINLQISVSIRVNAGYCQLSAENDYAKTIQNFI